MSDHLRLRREASRRRAWRQAFDHLAAADGALELEADDLERLAEAAWWTGRLGACISALESLLAAVPDRVADR